MWTYAEKSRLGPLDVAILFSLFFLHIIAKLMVIRDTMPELPS